MNVALGVMLLGIGLGLSVTLLGMLDDDWNELLGLGIGIISVTVLVFTFGFAIALIVGYDPGPQLVEGACYRAYGENTVVSTGKVFIPVHSVRLVEIRCP
jgi:hypothetical protein